MDPYFHGKIIHDGVDKSVVCECDLENALLLLVSAFFLSIYATPLVV